MSAAEVRVVEIVVNGQRRVVTATVRTLVSEVLRDDLNCTGVHVGCEHGVCGACTVLVDGVAMRSCLLLAPQVDGTEITTVEGLHKGDQLHPVQEAFWEHHGLQCGFCTPGIVMSVVGEARAGRDLDDTLDQVLGGHLCRCTGYVNIRAAIRAAWPALHDAGETS